MHIYSFFLYCVAGWFFLLIVAFIIIDKVDNWRAKQLTALYGMTPTALGAGMNQGNSNGQHRRTSQTPHSSPAVGASGGSGGAGAVYTQLTRVTRAHYTFPVSTPGGGGIVTPIRQGGNFVRLCWPGEEDFGEVNGALPAVVTPGEIIAHRIWLIEDGCKLRSVAAGASWYPGEPMTGDVNCWIAPGSVRGGVHSYKDYHYMWGDQHLGEWIFGFRQQKDIYGLAIGTVKIWGEVIEHEYGYRSEYAKIHTLDEIYGVDAAAVRYLYLGAKNDTNSPTLWPQQATDTHRVRL